jgi:hypothetical protein
MREAIINLDFCRVKQTLDTLLRIIVLLLMQLSRLRDIGALGIHQTSTKITSCVSLMKNEDQQALCIQSLRQSRTSRALKNQSCHPNDSSRNETRN